MTNILNDLILANKPQKIKTIKSKHNRDVDVSHRVRVDKNGIHTMYISAMCGGTVHTHTVTVGAQDGPREKPPTQEQLQALLDEHRQRAADESSWKEHVRSAIHNLD